MGSVVSDGVAEEGGDVRLKAFFSAADDQRRLENRADVFATFFQCGPGLNESNFQSIELLGNPAALGGGLQPHHSHVIHVCSDGAAFAVRWLCAPGCFQKAFE